MSRWEIVQGDCLEAMRGMGDGSVDAVVTDPPYGLAFMGKHWDHGLPGEAFWSEALRVAKPGAHLLAFGGGRTYHRLTCAIEDAGWEIRDCLGWLYGSGFPKSHNLTGELKGWGTALKPAIEYIVLARKPFNGTVAANVQEHGTGAINVDGCRVGVRNVNESGWSKTGSKASDNRAMSGANYDRGAKDEIGIGRWPANIIHDGSDEVMAVFRDAARFFYCAKASKADRDEGCEMLEELHRVNGNKWTDQDYRVTNGERPQSAESGPRRNHHPTVKPTTLMRYLCRLITPPNGVILDPFTGSGSTGKAALLEGFRFIGIECEPGYCEIARARIAAVDVDNVFEEVAS